MGRGREVQTFIDKARNVRSPKGLEALMADATRAMGFDNVTMFHHVDLAGVTPSLAHMRRGDLIGITTASVAWSEHYRDNNLVAVDPRVLATRCTTSPFRNDDLARIIRVGSVHRSVLERQARADIGESFTIPIHFPGEPSASCTFSMTRGRVLPAENCAMAMMIGHSAFQSARTMLAGIRSKGAATRRLRLTERQLQCTLLVGRGLSEVDIAARLGISYETVKRHLKEARTAYGVTKSVQLVTRALQDGQVTLRDLLAENVSGPH